MGGLQNLTEKRLRRFLTLSLALFMGASLFYVCFRYVLPWCLPFLLALLVAALLEPVVLYLRRKFHFQRGFSALILTLTLLFLLGGLLSLLWSTLLSQTNALLAAAPAFFRICAGSSPRLGGLLNLACKSVQAIVILLWNLASPSTQGVSSSGVLF